MNKKSIVIYLALTLIILSAFLNIHMDKLNEMENKLDEKNIQIELLTSEIKGFEEGTAIQNLREQNSILFLEMNIEKDKNDLLKQKLEFVIKRLENVE